MFDLAWENNLTVSTNFTGSRRIKRSVTDRNSQTKHYTTSKITVPFETTTEAIKHIDLHFDSPHNLEEKIKHRLRDAGVQFDDVNMTTPENGTIPTHAIYNDEFMEYAQKSDSGGMKKGEFNDFINKLKILKTYGTLNISKVRGHHAVKNFTPGTEDSASMEGADCSNSTEHILSNMRNLLNSSSISSNETSHRINYVTTTFVTTPGTTRKKRTRTTTVCTCPTYSDYRWMWHNISTGSKEEEFKLNETNRMIEIRHRWYNESSEPQYGDVSSCEDMKNITKTTKIRTIKTTEIKRTRKRRITTESNKNKTHDLTDKTSKRKIKKTTEIITTKLRRRKQKAEDPTSPVKKSTKAKSNLKQQTVGS